MMNLLLDTHLLIWALTDDKQLNEKAKNLILDENNTIYYSVVSAWEVSIKHWAHPENVTFSGSTFIEFCEAAEFVSLNLKNEHVEAVETLKRTPNSSKHSDPFDKILIAQAKSENFIFLTHDKLLKDYNENCIHFV